MLDAGAWSLRFASGPEVYNTSVGLEFVFGGPEQPMYYLYRDAPTRQPQRVRITGEIVASGAPVFDFRTERFNVCGSPATVRPFVMTRSDWAAEFGRWWASDAVVLAPGSWALSVAVQPEGWTSVYGKRGSDVPAEWNSAVQHIQRVGMTFGGGCFYGHGVFVQPGSGTARFLVTQFEVE